VKETRIFAAPVEVREESDGTATIAGYAAVFGNEYDIGGQFTESVDAKAFNRSLKNNAGDLAVVWSHDFDRVLGTVASGTARFSVDEHGLRYEADLDLQDPDGVGAWRKVSTGKVRQSSFSFDVVRDKWEDRADSPPHRVLKEVRLYEASPVLLAANPATEVDVKRAATSYAEYRGVDVDADSIEQVRNATTPDPEPDPAACHSEPTQDSEPARPFHPYI
jgi:uncharacterized protein